MRILYLEDSLDEFASIDSTMQRQGIAAAFIPVRSFVEFTTVLQAGGVDIVVIGGDGRPGCSVVKAIGETRQRDSSVPVIVCTRTASDDEVAAAFTAGANDYVLKTPSWQLAAALRRYPARSGPRPMLRHPGVAQLIDVVQKLSLARGLDAIVDIVRQAARQLTGADGATFVLRDGHQCYYADEDAISPLWKGQRFPLEDCISGWAMLNRKSTVIPDIYEDPRIPHAAYRPTFVHSLAMVPIRSAAPIGAIGNYWANRHECTSEELALLEALANTTAVAIENVNIYQNLERQVRERTRELQAVNQEVEAFSAAVSHDLRAPLRAMNAELDLRLDASGGLPATSVAKLRESTSRMAELIDDLLRLSGVGRTELQRQPIDLGALTNEIIERMRVGGDACFGPSLRVKAPQRRWLTPAS